MEPDLSFWLDGMRSFFSGCTKALLCNHLGVKSALCAVHNGAQRQGAGGPAESAQTQLWAEPLPSGSIWVLLTSVAGPAQLPLGWHTMMTLSTSFVMTFWASFNWNLKYFIRPPSAAVFLWSYYIKQSKSLLSNPSPWRATKDFSKYVWVLMHSCCSTNTEMFKFHTVQWKNGGSLFSLSSCLWTFYSLDGGINPLLFLFAIHIQLLFKGTQGRSSASLLCQEGIVGPLKKALNP